MRRKLPAFLLFTLLSLLTACSLLNRSPALGHETVLEGEASLVCSQECADRAQCGEAQGVGSVVLAGLTAPAVENHEQLFVSDSAAFINSYQPLTVQPLDGSASFPVNFYDVVVLDDAGNPVQSGWVAGWCVEGG